MTERRESSWIDYGNLAANLVQVRQLSTVQKRLKQLAEIEAAREERIRLLNELRQFVFEAEEGLLQLTEYTTIAPRGVFIAVSVLKSAFDEIGITPQTFEEFTDKDRVKHIRELIQKRIEEALQYLSEEQSLEAQRMLLLIPKLSDLETLISAKEAKAELAKTDLEWKSLDEDRNKSLKSWFLLIGGSVAWCVISYGLTNLLVLIMDAYQVRLYLLPMVTRIIILLVFILVVLGIPIIALTVGLLNVFRLLASKRLNELNKQRAVFLRRLLSSEKYKALTNEFGEMTNDEYKSLRTEILDYIERITTTDENGNNLPTSLLSIAIPKRILEQGKAG